MIILNASPWSLELRKVVVVISRHILEGSLENMGHHAEGAPGWPLTILQDLASKRTGTLILNMEFKKKKKDSPVKLDL